MRASFASCSLADLDRFLTMLGGRLGTFRCALCSASCGRRAATRSADVRPADTSARRSTIARAAAVATGWQGCGWDQDGRQQGDSGQKTHRATIGVVRRWAQVDVLWPNG